MPFKSDPLFSSSLRTAPTIVELIDGRIPARLLLDLESSVFFEDEGVAKRLMRLASNYLWWIDFKSKPILKRASRPPILESALIMFEGYL